MDAILFRTHVFNKKIIDNIKILNILVGNVFVVYDNTDREPFPEIGVPVFSFSVEDYEKSGYKLATLDQIYELPTAPALGNRSGAIYFNPEYAQILAMKWLDEQGLKFENYWYWEYDVIFNGNPRALFHKCRENKSDLLTTMIRAFPHSPTFEKFWKMLNFDLNEKQQLAMFGPVWRGSRLLLETLDKEYSSGKHGFYETIVPTLAAMNDLTIADINNCGIFYNPLTLNGKGITHFWSQEFVSNMKNMIFHPAIQNDSSFLFATGYISNESKIERYIKWIQYYNENKSKIGADELVIFDDCSNIELVQQLQKVIQGNNIEFNIIDYDKLPDELCKGVNWIRFDSHLGRPSVHITAGWHRSFSYAGVIAKHYGYDKIVHVESDTYILTDRLFNFIHDSKNEWSVLFNKDYNFPDTCIQIIHRDHFKYLEQLYELGEKFWFKAETNKTFIAEFVFKFTNIVRYFNGSWHGGNIEDAPKDVDYFADFPVDIQLRKKQSPDINKVQELPKPDFGDMIEHSISIVCHNRLDVTQKCISSVFQYTKNFELIICDNASEDGTKEYLQSLADNYGERIKLTFNGKNEGFLKPQNRNSKLAVGRYFVTLNNDIIVCENWLEVMVEPFTADNGIGIVGVSGACGSLHDNGQGYLGKELEYIEASCMVVPKFIIDHHGLFDENNFEFAYCEDVDFSLRLRENGYSIKTVDLPIKHDRASTSKIVKDDLEGYRVKNHKILLQKWKLYFKHRNFNYKILFIRKGALGDTILMTGIVKQVRDRYPLSHISVQSECYQVFINNPYINFATNVEQNIEDYDIVYDLDLAYEKEPQIHIIDAYSKVCKLPGGNRDTYLYSSPEDDERIKLLYGDRKIAIFHTQHTGGWHGRNLPHQRYLYASEYLKNKGYTIVELGYEKILDSDIKVKKSDFSNLCALIKHAEIFVGQDSGLFHIAQTFGIPAVVPFGMITPAYRVLDYRFVHPVIAKDIACRGCHHWTEGIYVTSTKCLRDKVYCMENITDIDMRTAIDKANSKVYFQSETAKCRERLSKYCVGNGIDCGYGGDAIINNAITVDLPKPYTNVGDNPENLSGDASDLYWFADNTMDYLYSSHLLEDFIDTEKVLREWLRVIKKGGRIIIYCPDEQVYRKHCRDTGQPYNENHKLENFGLKYLKEVFTKIGQTKVIHETALIDEYSFEIVVEKI